MIWGLERGNRLREEAMSAQKHLILFKILLGTFLVLLLLSCATESQPARPVQSPIASAVNTEPTAMEASPTLQPTSTATPAPTSTSAPTIMPSPTPTPTLIGGGGLIAFSSIRLGSRFANPQSDIVVLNPNGGALTWLTDNEEPAVREHPSWSPNGDRLVFTRNNLLYIVGIDGSSEEELNSPFGSGLYHPSWSRNNEILAIYAPQGKYPQVWISPADSSDWNAITPDLSFQFDPVWSPDGSAYAFSGAPGTIYSQWLEFVFYGFRLTYYDIKPRDIYIVDVENGDVTQLTGGPQDEFHPAWSPDGQKLAFVSIQDSKNPEIFVMNRDGSGLTRLTNNPAQDVYPSWSPDGTMLTFTSDRDGNFEIYVMAQDGENPIRMTDNLIDDFQPVWSPLQENPVEYITGETVYSFDLTDFRPQKREMKDVVNLLYREGLIDTNQGQSVSLRDYRDEWAQLGWYAYSRTGRKPQDFVIRADATWESASETADWWGSGCGLVFREKDEDNHYLAFLGMDGVAQISKWYGGYQYLIGRSQVRYPLETPKDGANIMLAVQGDNFKFFVNGLLVLTERDSSLDSGNLALTLLSGTNKDFGTRCEMSNIELWTLGE
jgi:Tol biopolymer transport system component